MSNHTKLNMAERLSAAQLAIDAVLADPDVQAALTPYGYDVAAMTAARALYDEVQTLTAVQKLEYGEQYEATQNLNKAWATADAAYTNSLQLARIAFKKNGKGQSALGLNGRRKESYSGWVEQVTLFYKGLLDSPALQAEMTKYGYNTAKWEAEYALVQAVVAANVVQEREKGEAQDATKARDAALDELDEWLSDFKAVSQIALANMGQKLEGLGFGPVP